MFGFEYRSEVGILTISLLTFTSTSALPETATPPSKIEYPDNPLKTVFASLPDAFELETHPRVINLCALFKEATVIILFRFRSCP